MNVDDETHAARMAELWRMIALVNKLASLPPTAPWPPLKDVTAEPGYIGDEPGSTKH